MAVMIYGLSKEEILSKFDEGRKEHNDDVSGLVKENEQRNEAIDFVAYEAL